ncbi:MAG: FadR family transcriptional regulator [Ideonella sp.]|jgi:DNA-binding FadR family transcriptional regulator|nr:FadR family transcriptional regulator [Ideonella sp.]
MPPTSGPDLAPPSAPRRRPRNLAAGLVDALAARIRENRYPAGERLPSETAIVEEFGVSRTVVREAISKLQAAGLVETRHGIGTFVIGLGDAAPFRVSPEQLATLQDVISVLELRIAVETEAAALAAQRRDEDNLQRMRAALAAFAAAVEEGRDAVGPDFQFHLEVARATHNERFADIVAALGTGAIPRARLAGDTGHSDEHKAYLRRVNVEHESILEAIAAGDGEAARAAMRTHLANSRERRRRAASASLS